MRLSLLAAAAVIGLLLAGCVAEEPTTTLPPQERSADVRPDLNTTLADMPEFCQADDAACLFWDQEFHEYVVYDLDTTVIDVVIVPPAGPSALDVLAASRLSVQAWEDGIRHFAKPWFNDSFEVNVYAVGMDVPSVDAVQDPEIVVLSTSAEFLVGIGLEPKQLACIVLAGGGAILGQPLDVARASLAALATAPSAGGSMAETLGAHTHAGNHVFATDCTGTGFTCFAINVGAMDARGLYDLISHEVGHCFGAGHVGDAGDFRSRYAPIEDIMSYQENPEQVHCVSNLNVRVLEGVYAHLVEGADAEPLPRGSYYHIDPRDYVQAPCPNPDEA